MENIYFNHDGSIDDLASLLLLSQTSDTKLIGISAIDGDGYINPAVEAYRKTVDKFNLRGGKLEAVRPNSRAIYQFPKEWRMATYSLNYFPILSESGEIETPEAPLPIHLDMIDKIKKVDGPVTLIMTEPVTDLAKVLDEDVSIQSKIEKVYWMGGSLDGHGNVVNVDADETQEWNAFWDPEVIRRVLDSDLDTQMIGLESTEELSLTDELWQHWASLRKCPATDLVGLGYSLTISVPNAELYLWDVLTTMPALYPELAETRQTKANIITSDLASGWAFIDPNGKETAEVTKANKDSFFERVDKILERQ